MTSPGFNAHQAAQRADRQAQQAAARATQHAVQHASDAARVARESAQRSRSGGITPPRMGTYHGSSHQVSGSGLVRGLAGLVAVAVVVGILLTVLGAVAPDWFDQVRSFFGGLF